MPNSEVMHGQLQLQVNHDKEVTKENNRGMRQLTN